MATRGYDTWRWTYWGKPGTASVTGTQEIVSYKWTGMVGTNPTSWTNAKIVPALKQLNAVFAAHNYDVDSAGSYNYRRITNGTVFSPHAWGIAVDINPAQNPYVSTGLVTDIDLDIVRDAYKIRTAKTGQRVWKWGGDWDGDWNFDDHTVWDAMHFEVIATPVELAEGLVFDGELVTEVEVPMLSQGASGNAVKWFQTALNGFQDTYGDPANKIAVDGAYGPATVTAVKGYQRSAGLQETGSIDGVTAVLVSRFHPTQGVLVALEQPAPVVVNAYSKAEVDAKLATKAAVKHSHTGKVTVT